MVSRKAASGSGSVPAMASPSAWSAPVSSVGNLSRRSSARWRSSSASPSRNARARATLPSAAAAAATISGSFAGEPVATATAAATSVSTRGRKVRMRQRERKVAGTRAAEWLTSSNSARCGGSSSTLSSALALDLLSSSTASTMAMRQPPSRAVEPKNATVRRMSSTAICLCNTPLSLSVRSRMRRSGWPCAAMRRATGWSGSTASDVALATSGAAGSGCASTKRARR